MATGGFISDKSASSLLNQYRPDLLDLKRTNPTSASGDGHKLAIEIGSSLINMQLIQVHPTAFVDPKRPDEEQKTLCAEILRGVGGILLNSKGKRFCNELGRRDYVVSKMKEQNTPNLHFTILLPNGVEKLAAKHI